jgi:hypothetical protein
MALLCITQPTPFQHDYNTILNTMTHLSGSTNGFSSGGTCVVDNSWTHPKHGDKCTDYIGGKSKSYGCTSEVLHTRMLAYKLETDDF